MDEQQSMALDKALPALAAFKRAFGRDASPSFIAELLAPKQFHLKLDEGCNEPGSDGLDAEGKKYQIKHRSPNTLNVDLNNSSFDFIVLVNVDDNYRRYWNLANGPGNSQKGICPSSGVPEISSYTNSI